MDLNRHDWDATWRRVIGAVGRRDPDPQEAAEALATLSDISDLRRLLEHGELRSVQAARRLGASWAEIATNLGVTRQSAWERWRELDGPQSLPPEPVKRAGRLRASAAAAINATVGELTHDVRRRRPAQPMVAVPDIVGLSCADARAVVERAGLVPMSHVGGGSPLPLTSLADGVIVDQVPQAGARRRMGSLVTVWVERGGGSAGVREPRRPVPPPKSLSVDDPALSGPTGSDQ